MKILILGAFGEGALENYYVSGLKKQNAIITTYDIADIYYASINRSIVHKGINKLRPSYFFTPINDSLLQFLKGKSFDVILVFKGLALFPTTIGQLKRHARLLCCYNPDHPFKFYSEGSGNKNIEGSIKSYDVYFTYAEQITRDLRQIYSVNACTIPFGYDDQATGITLLPDHELLNNCLFIGAYDKERADFITQLANEDVFIYGDEKWSTRNKKNTVIRKAYQQRPLYDEAYKVAVKHGLGVFNILRRQNIEEGSHNMRTFEVPGYGGLLIANRTPEQMAFFEEDKEAIYFGSIQELNDKLLWLQNNRTHIEKMKLAANDRARRSGYSYHHRSKAMYNFWTDYL